MFHITHALSRKSITTLLGVHIWINQPKKNMIWSRKDLKHKSKALTFAVKSEHPGAQMKSDTQVPGVLGFKMNRNNLLCYLPYCLSHSPWWWPIWNCSRMLGKNSTTACTPTYFLIAVLRDSYLDGLGTSKILSEKRDYKYNFFPPKAHYPLQTKPICVLSWEKNV